MHSIAHDVHTDSAHPVGVAVASTVMPRNRLTVAFRPILAIPHLLLVGGPIALVLGWSWQSEPGTTHESSAGGGVLGAVAVVSAMISWFAIVFTGNHPEGLRSLTTYYLRWRVRAAAYVTLLRDEYPPFGDAPYPATLITSFPTVPRDRVSVAFRLLLIVPHLIALCVLSVAWIVVTIVAWLAILITGHFPARLEAFSRSVLQWNTRVEAYALLLHDEYPPFRLDP
ncbi:MAG: DUF4389 domain-containing protein [Gemmatimonadaceae bacterium]|nr:DUF4389 domain-containing protein [Gemmatimonadaceae bacterium]